MSRDQRMKGNWALLHACEKAAESGSPVAVAFNLVSHACLPALALPGTTAVRFERHSAPSSPLSLWDAQFPGDALQLFSSQGD